MSTQRTPPNIITLILLTALAVLSLNMFLPSLPQMAASFGTDYETISLAVGGYLAVTTVMQLFAGPLSDRYGRRPVILGALLIYLIASIGCVLAYQLGWFLLFRTFQGVIISGWVVSLAVVRDTRPEKEAASLIGYIVMAMAIAPMIGPLVGGMLDEAFGWRSNFVLMALFGALLLVLCFVNFGETNQEPSSTFGAQFRAYPELFRSKRFWGYAICMASSNAMFYAFLAGSPLVAATVLGLGTAELGFYMGTISAGFIAGSYCAGRYSSTFELTTMIITGRIIACLGLGSGLAFVLAGEINVWTIFGAAVFAGFGNGLTIPGSGAGAMSVRPKLAGSAAGLAGALAIGSGAITTAVTAALISPDNGAIVLLAIMFLLAVIGLVTALLLRLLEQRADQVTA
ncbi:MAG: multidrug effflux MFS transporter [Rhizobiaceae bacterium]